VSIADIHFGGSGVSPAAGRLPAPPPERQQDQQDRDDELGPGRPLGRAAAAAHVPGVGHEVDDDAHGGDAHDPAEGEHRAVHPARAENRTRITAMIGTGLIATPTAKGSTC
jgi:hypothetical protein